MSKNEHGNFHITCKSCDRLFTVSPPSSEYTQILQKDCERGDSMRKERNCPACEQENIVIWDRDHNLPFNRDVSSDLKLSGLD
jgi:C4-type Zn-finger protein